MSQTQEKLDLSEEVSRHILGVGEDSGLLMIKGISQLSARARGNCLMLEGPAEKIRLVKKFLELLARRIEQAGALEQYEVKRLFDQFVNEDLIIQWASGQGNDIRSAAICQRDRE
jgi:hypothetical protein